MDLDKILFKLVLFILLWFGFNGLTTFLLGFNLFLFFFGKRVFATFMAKQPDKYNKVVDPFKKTLFSELDNLKPGNGRSKLKVLEIGGGSGANFKYFNVPVEVDVIEPNLHMSPYFEETRAQYNGGKLHINPMMEGYGENLKAAGIEDESYDLVIQTLVFCAVQDPAQVFKEVHRVLRPGGKFLFMDHIVAKESSPTRMVQRVCMLGGFWPAMFDGCVVDRDVPMIANQSQGWSKMELKEFELPENDNEGLLKVFRHVIKPHVMGVAEK